MSNTGTLYKMELKKILMKKIVWIMLAIGIVMFISNVLPIIGENNIVFPDGTSMSVYEAIRIQKNTSESISGKKIDDSLLNKMRNDIRAFLADKEDLPYKGRNKSDTYPGIWFAARKLGYEDFMTKLYNQFGDADDPNKKIMECTAGEYYRMVRDNLDYTFENEGVTEEEKAFWIQKFSGSGSDITYEYAAGWNEFADPFVIYIWFAFLLISVSLAGTFSEENAFRTDAVILSAKNGRTPVCLAKLWAGITVAAVEMVLIIGINMAVCLGTYGIGGWNAPLIMIAPYTAWNITVGQAFTLLIWLSLVMSVVFAVFTMFLSRLSGKSMAVIAVQFAIFFICLFSIPNNQGLISRLWEIRPTGFLNIYTFMEYRLFKIRGSYLDVFQMGTVIYIIIIAALIPVICHTYKHMQIKSR
ncbi:MAG: hypothetical protein IKD83_02120 [Firmicutes bacterium]|nr:hypothetical protein [Bacillota bacterium]